MTTIPFKMGDYTGYRGQQPPLVELRHHNGECLRFLSTSFADGDVCVIRIAANGSVTNGDRSRDAAEMIYGNAIANGYSVTRNVPGGLHAIRLED